MNTGNIVVYELGGYLPYSQYKDEFDELELEYENVLIELKYLQKDFHNIGEKGIYCLNKALTESPFEKDTYEFVCGSYAYMKYENGSYYVRENDDKNNYSLSLKAIYKIIGGNKYE